MQIFAINLNCFGVHVIGRQKYILHKTLPLNKRLFISSRRLHIYYIKIIWFNNMNTCIAHYENK